jgi:flagellar assembly factor FliW
MNDLMNDQDVNDAVVTFAEGLPGFESSRRFLLVRSQTIEPFTLVQGLDESGPSFLAIEPALVAPAYAAAIDAADRARLAAGPDQALLWLALVTPESEGAPTVNLRAPLVINPASMRGIQLVPAESPYRVDHPLSAA